MKKTLSALLVTAIISTTVCSSDNDNNEGSVSNKEKAVAVLNSIETGDQEAVNYINPDQYTQHNLSVADGLEGFGAVLAALPEGSASVDVQRIFQDGEYIFTHTDYNFFGPKVGFDLFRFEDGLIVEHWDNLAEKVMSNPSGHTQLDGATEIKDLDKTENNKDLVADFVDTILINGNYAELPLFIDEGEENYIQHNVAIGDGLSGLSAALEAMAEQGITMTYSQNHLIVGEGNFVLSISEGSFGGEHVSFYDLFRVENNKIVEHWDTIETILPEDQRLNTNGKFGFKG